MFPSAPAAADEGLNAAGGQTRGEPTRPATPALENCSGVEIIVNSNPGFTGKLSSNIKAKMGRAHPC